MENKNFLQGCQLISEHLSGLEVNKVQRSIGSNVFFKFGNDEEFVYPNGRKRLMKEWSIWLSGSSWKLTKKGLYLVGSGDDEVDIDLNIQQLIGKKFHSLHLVSSFLDVEFNFNEGYQLTTFFNWLEEDQWTVFLPKRFQLEPIRVNCSSKEEIKYVQEISKNFSIIEKYRKIELSSPEDAVTSISYNHHDQPNIHFGKDLKIQFKSCTWRLEKDGDYILGYLDQDEIDYKSELSKLIGKKLIETGVANSMMDARFQFEDGYVLKTFTCCHASSQWVISSKTAPIFEANIQFVKD